MMSNLTAERLRELLDYDPGTGVFTNRVQRNSRAMPGTVAGRIDGDGYVQIKIDGRDYRAHRLAWLYVHGHWPAGDLDHIDRDRTNNALANLRDATRSINSQNSVHPLGLSGRRGVTAADSLAPRWVARVCVAGRRVHLGHYDSPDEAAQVAHDARCIFYPGHPAADEAERGRAVLRVLNRAAQAAHEGR